MASNSEAAVRSPMTAPMVDHDGHPPRTGRTPGSGSGLDRGGGPFGSQNGRFGVAWLLGRLSWRRWAVAMGVSDGGLVVVAAAVSSGLAMIGWWAADRWSPAATAGTSGPAESVLLSVAVGLWALASAFGIFAAHAAAAPPSLGFLRTLPVTPRQVGRAAALPLSIVAAAGLLAVGPLIVRVTTTSTGWGLPHAVGLLALLTVSGVAVGTILQRLAARPLDGPGWGSLRLTAAYLAWCLVVATSVLAPLPLLQRLGPALGLLALAPLGWSLAWWAMIDPTPFLLLGALAATAGLVAGAAHLRPAGTSASAVRARASVRLVPMGRPLPVVRVQARRLVRHPRVLEALVVAGFFGVVLALGAGWTTRRLPGVLSPTVVALLCAQVTAAPAVLARGLSDRRRPVEARLGIGAGEHVLATAAAALGIAALVSLPGLVVALVLLPASVTVTWLAALPLLVATGMVVSWALAPELGNGSAEGGAVLAYAAASAAMLALVDHLPAPTVAAAPKVTLAALAAAVVLEHVHRRPT